MRFAHAKQVLATQVLREDFHHIVLFPHILELLEDLLPQVARGSVGHCDHLIDSLLGGVSLHRCRRVVRVFEYRYAELRFALFLVYTAFVSGSFEAVFHRPIEPCRFVADLLSLSSSRYIFMLEKELKTKTKQNSILTG